MVQLVHSTLTLFRAFYYSIHLHCNDKHSITGETLFYNATQVSEVQPYVVCVNSTLCRWTVYVWCIELAVLEEIACVEVMEVVPDTFSLGRARSKYVSGRLSFACK